MKKNLLSILASICFLFSYSQVSDLKFTYEKEKIGYANQVSDNLRQSAPFWSEDFQSGIPLLKINIFFSSASPSSIH